MNRSTLTLKAQTAAASLGRRLVSPAARPLASAPAGSELRSVPGDPGIPLLGDLLEVLGDPLNWARDRYTRYGEVSWLNAFGSSFVLALGPDAIGEVFADRQKVYSNAEGWGFAIGEFFERGLMLLDFEEHHHHRRIMQQAFTRDRLISYLGMMNPTIAQGISTWQPGSAFHVQPAIKQLTLDVATKVFLGTELGPEADRLNQAFIDLVQAGRAMVRADVPGGAWHRGVRGRKLLEDYFHRQLPAKRTGTPTDLFGVLAQASDENGETLTDADVVNHMIFVLMAAHDTSTSTATMMCYLLGRHPEWQERLRAESRALGRDALEYGDLDRLVGLDLVMKETLRMYSPVGTVMRRALADTELRGHHIPAGTRILVGLYASHRIGDWWKDPDTFDPERFAESRREDKSHRYAFTPFSGNAHKCIGMHFGGMEVKALMHQLLLTHSWSVPPGYHPPLGYGTGPMAADELPLRLRRLEH